MKARPDIKLKNSQHVTVGSVIIAQPFWGDEIYKRAVILITDHDANGSRGIIINKASTVHINEALPEINAQDPVYFGGPIASRMISYVHAIPTIPEADYLGNDLYLGGDPASLEDMIKDHEIDFEKIKFCAGIVEWNSGQLDYEINENKWWIAQLTADELFNSPPETLWSYKLLQSGNMYGLFAHIPDPSLS
jgi:putative transcriptional regulator